MRYHELDERRRNPELNPKLSVNKAIVLHAEQARANSNYIGDRYPNSFVSFTKLEKIGINPSSEFDTPIGIYAYPSYYVINQVNDGSDEHTMDNLPYAGTAPYATLFSAKGNIVVLGRTTEPDWDTLVQVGKSLGLSDQKVKSCIEGGKDAARVQTPMGQWFYASRLMAIELTTERKPRSTAVVWNKIFRLCGIDGLLDPGVGIIHPNEPTQAVFFHAGAIDRPVRVANKYSQSAVDFRQQAGSVAQSHIGLINNILRKGNLSEKDFVEIAKILIALDYETKDTVISNRTLLQILANPAINEQNVKQLFDVLRKEKIISTYGSNKLRNAIQASRKIPQSIKDAYDDWQIEYLTSSNLFT